MPSVINLEKSPQKDDTKLLYNTLKSSASKMIKM